MVQTKSVLLHQTRGRAITFIGRGEKRKLFTAEEKYKVKTDAMDWRLDARGIADSLVGKTISEIQFLVSSF
ncbi:hypothetical protein AB733_14275 [Photobacterium swingsii]|uniref:Uncharacterized protein n=1 Tax=Photobacterium swingsii TaxID=680026 RepID=A0A0J8VA17_9GAMM|nr:hypothetical protein AB733_14275 [Photobacterium swingsii]PSW23009.1 hypothetical protein C9I94_17675 [Photobacterium swingsii]